MNIQQAILKAQDEGKEIALPTNEFCVNDGYQIRLKPYMDKLVLLEYYGRQMKDEHFPLPPKDIIKDNWIVID